MDPFIPAIIIKPGLHSLPRWSPPIVHRPHPLRNGPKSSNTHFENRSTDPISLKRLVTPSEDTKSSNAQSASYDKDVRVSELVYLRSTHRDMFFLGINKEACKYFSGGALKLNCYAFIFLPSLRRFAETNRGPGGRRYKQPSNILTLCQYHR